MVRRRYGEDTVKIVRYIAWVIDKRNNTSLLCYVAVNLKSLTRLPGFKICVYPHNTRHLRSFEIAFF